MQIYIYIYILFIYIRYDNSLDFFSLKEQKFPACCLRRKLYQIQNQTGRTVLWFKIFSPFCAGFLFCAKSECSFVLSLQVPTGFHFFLHLQRGRNVIFFFYYYLRYKVHITLIIFKKPILAGADDGDEQVAYFFPTEISAFQSQSNRSLKTKKR